MFRTMTGFKAQYHYLTILAAAEFDAWKVMLYAPGVSIHGARQFGEAKAKEHALSLAQKFVHDQKKDDLPLLPEVTWTPFDHDSWLLWHS